MQPGNWPTVRMDHVDTVNRAGCYAKITTRTFVFNYRVHEFGGANDGIHRASLNTLGAADAFIFPDYRNLGPRKQAMCRIQGFINLVQQNGQAANGAGSSGWTFVDGFALADSPGIGKASCEATLTTLCLWKFGIDDVYDRYLPLAGIAKLQTQSNQGPAN